MSVCLMTVLQSYGMVILLSGVQINLVSFLKKLNVYLQENEIHFNPANIYHYFR
jgi:hypothetical protein